MRPAGRIVFQLLLLPCVSRGRGLDANGTPQLQPGCSALLYRAPPPQQGSLHDRRESCLPRDPDAYRSDSTTVMSAADPLHACPCCERRLVGTAVRASAAALASIQPPARLCSTTSSVHATPACPGRHTSAGRPGACQQGCIEGLTGSCDRARPEQFQGGPRGILHQVHVTARSRKDGLLR